MRPLSYWTCVLLHKLKALLGPQGVQNVSILSSKLPLEITYQIQGEFATSAMTSYAEFASDIRRGRVVSPRVKTLQQHIEALVNAIHEEDDCFWAFFMDPQQRFTPGPGCRCSGLGEAHHTMNRCYNTFAETPGAVVISLRTWFSRIHSTAAARESPQKTQKHVH